MAKDKKETERPSPEREALAQARSVLERINDDLAAEVRACATASLTLKHRFNQVVAEAGAARRLIDEVLS